MASRPAPQPQIQSRGPVRISLPASVAYNADALKKTIASVVDQLGCRTCFSGADCHFLMERNLAVDKEGKLRSEPDPVPWRSMDPVPSPWHVLVAFQGQTAFKLENVYKAVDGIIANLGGCPGCHSGRDISYLAEVSLVGVTNDLQVQQYGEQLSE